AEGRERIRREGGHGEDGCKRRARRRRSTLTRDQRCFEEIARCFTVHEQRAAAAEYSEATAVDTPTQVHQAEHRRPALELARLDRTLAGYGGTSRTDAARQRVFDLLAERQHPRAELPPRTVQSCVEVSLAEDTPRVKETYRQFTRQPGASFLSQLHVAFAALCRAENSCLQRLSDARRRLAITAR
ncbi:MAG TPA: hypothetical protein PLU22_08055, partial [Polyangiaceae bacterium]|nr:hypothetical protein [Polyangiaceae bacterium]